MNYLIEDGTFLSEAYSPVEKNVIIPDGIECICQGAFAICSDKEKMETVEMPDSVVEIEGHAFELCINLSQVSIGKGIKKIAKDAFAKCQNLNEVHIDVPQKKVKIHPDAFPKKTAIIFKGEDVSETVMKLNYDMKLSDAKEKYSISKRNAGFSINDFSKDGRIEGPFSPDYNYVFSKGVKDKCVFIPDTLDGKTVCHVAVKALPDDAIIICSAALFRKLGRKQKVSTACAWLTGFEGIQEDERQVIIQFIKKYTEDVVCELALQGDVNAFRKLIDLIKPESSILTKVLDIATDTEIRALLMEKMKDLEKPNLLESIESKPMTVSELKKIWTYKKVIDGNTEEEYIELTNYKGISEKATIPAVIGKLPVKVISGVMPSHVKEVLFESSDIKINCSFRECTAMADKDGFIVVLVGDRTVLTDYIGSSQIETLIIPDGVTEIESSVFKDIKMGKVIFPASIEKIGQNSFMNCTDLHTVEFPKTLKEIGQMAFCGCVSLKEIFIPFSVATIGGGAFYQIKDLKIYATKGSFAEQYAVKNNITFEEREI